MFALTSGPFAFGFAIYWLVGHVWWQGLAAIVTAPILGITLIAAATFFEIARMQSGAEKPSVAQLYVLPSDTLRGGPQPLD